MSFKDKINLLVDLCGITYITHKFSVSKKTVERWMNGENEPHPAMIDGMKLDEAIELLSK